MQPKKVEPEPISSNQDLEMDDSINDLGRGESIQIVKSYFIIDRVENPSNLVF
jgi:hypothetical protein